MPAHSSSSSTFSTSGSSDGCVVRRRKLNECGIDYGTSCSLTRRTVLQQTLCRLTAEPTSVDDVVDEDQLQYVLAVLGSDCTMLKIIFKDEAIVIETGDHDEIYSVAFHSDGTQLLSGNKDGFQRWRVANGQVVGNQMAMDFTVFISMSRDGRWIVCGTIEGAIVWDEKIQEKAIDGEGTDYVCAVDISPESTRFATAAVRGNGDDYNASIWNIITGERLVGPLQHDGYFAGIKFSRNGEHIATAVQNRSIGVFDSRNGDQLITIKTDIPSWSPSTLLVWSNNGQQIFAASSDHKIKSFDVFAGSQRVESQVYGGGGAVSIALAANGRFLATGAERSISFWDTSTLNQIGPVIEDRQWVRSIALSQDCSYLATGGFLGKITIRNLNDILPDLYVRFRVSIYAPQSCRISHILSFPS